MKNEEDVLGNECLVTVEGNAVEVLDELDILLLEFEQEMAEKRSTNDIHAEMRCETWHDDVKHGSLLFDDVHLFTPARC